MSKTIAPYNPDQNSFIKPNFPLKEIVKKHGSLNNGRTHYYFIPICIFFHYIYETKSAVEVGIQLKKVQKAKNMKTNLIFLVAFICGFALTAHAQIPNPGFENWTSGNPDGWGTSNAFPAGMINVTQTTDCHSGSYAVRGDVINFFGTPMGPAIQSGPGGKGFPVSEQYHSLELYYKFTPIGGDKFSVNVGLKKAGVPIAQGLLHFLLR